MSRVLGMTGSRMSAYNMIHLFWKGSNLQFMEKKSLTSMIYKLQEMRLISIQYH